MSEGLLDSWVRSIAEHTTPRKIHFCDGSAKESQMLEEQMVRDGTLLALNSKTHPHSFLHRSKANDVARTEKLTFICCKDAEDAGPQQQLDGLAQAKKRVWPLFRTPWRAGPCTWCLPDGPARVEVQPGGVQLTDSPYVVATCGC